MPPKRNKASFGSIGEDYAERLLKKHRYKIIDRNYRLLYGEIDIIALKNDRLYFVEVKTRSSERFGLPEEAVNNRKLERIKKAAYTYILNNKGLPEKHMILVVSILTENGIIKRAKIIEVV